MTEHREVAVEVTIAAPLEVVWRALRDRTEIRRWLGWEYDQLEAEIEEMFFTGATESEADHRLDMRGGVFQLEDHGHRTVVRVVMAAAPDDPSWEGYYDDIKQGWLSFAQQLRFALERHRGEDRSTVYVSGPARDSGQPSVLELLGLGAVAHQAQGERYTAAAATGDTLAGEVWFRSEHQLGLTVDDWGEGLLVVTDKWTPDGASGAILTTFRLDADALAALADRWQGWWSRHFRHSDEAEPADAAP